MRFDDRIQTARAMTGGGDSHSAARWTQLVDLLAQDSGLDALDRKAAIAEARELSIFVPLDCKRSAALAIGARTRNADLVELFGVEPPRVAAPVLLGTTLAESDWLAVTPRLLPSSRALLRERRDLSQAVVKALSAYGTSDFAIRDDRHPVVAADQSAPVGADRNATIPGGASRISDLVARIENWQQHRGQAIGGSGPIGRESTQEAPADRFSFESDDTGRLVWVNGVPRAAVIGISLSELAGPVCAGVDGQTAGAFAKRADISGGRLILPDGLTCGGLWSLNAKPLFDTSSGRFTGYAGVAKRVEEQAQIADSEGPASDIVRQVVHELRSPLNAIRGFAEMIHYQVSGPVAQSYRSKAMNIVREADQLLELIESLNGSDAGQPTARYHPVSPSASSGFGHATP